MQGDAAAVAKTLRDYARTNPNLVVKGGLLGDKVLSAADVAALADLPPRDVLLARLAGALQAPLVKMAGLLQALPRNFAYGLRPSSTRAAAAPPPPPRTTPSRLAEADDAAADAPSRRRPPTADADVPPTTERCCQRRRRARRRPTATRDQRRCSTAEE